MGLAAVAALYGRSASADAPTIQRPRSLTAAMSQARSVSATPVSAAAGEETSAAEETPAAAETPAAQETAPAQEAPAAAPTSTAAPTSESAPAPPRAPAPVATDPVGDPIGPAAAAGPAGLHKRSGSRDLRNFSHQGFTFDFRIGSMGCVKSMCSRHDVRPGVRLDGFVGGNIRGWLDLGISGGWGALSSNPTKGANVLALYGLDPYLMQQALGVLGGQALGIDLTSLAVQSAKLRTAQVGPMLRVHFIPRGRYAAWVGTGAQYNLLRAGYDTAAGAARLDFHGLAVPLEAGFAVFVLRNLAVGAQFDYAFTWYPLANIEKGDQSFTIPTRLLDQAARMQQSTFKSQLPQFWTVALTLRARL